VCSSDRAVHLAGRARARRRAARIARCTASAAADVELAAALVRAARPLVPLAAFVGAFLVTLRG